MINAIIGKVPALIGGSADLTPSNNTQPKDAASLKKGDFNGRYIRFGIREHGMAAAMNGMALHGGVRPYSGTFMAFTDYARPAMRLSDCHNIDDFRKLAKARLPFPVFDYIDGAADDELTKARMAKAA